MVNKEVLDYKRKEIYEGLEYYFTFKDHWTGDFFSEKFLKKQKITLLNNRDPLPYIKEQIESFLAEKKFFFDELFKEIVFRLLNDQNPFLYIKKKMEDHLIKKSLTYTLQKACFGLYLENDKDKKERIDYLLETAAKMIIRHAEKEKRIEIANLDEIKVSFLLSSIDRFYKSKGCDLSDVCFMDLSPKAVLQKVRSLIKNNVEGDDKKK